MALTPVRWIGLAIGGMLAVFILLSRGRNERQRTPEEAQLHSAEVASNLHGSRAQRLARDYRTALLADSLRNASRGATAPTRILFGPGLSAETRATVDTIASRAMSALGPRPRINVDVVTLLDTASVSGYTPWGSSTVAPFYVLPARPSDRCIAVLPVGWTWSGNHRGLRNALRTEDAQLQILGPCRYYATFGMPGASIREWLRQRGALLALGGSWSHPPGAAPADFVYGPYYGTKSEFFPEPSWHYYYFAPRAVNCLAGDVRECESAVLKKTPGASPVAVGSAVRLGYSLGPVGIRSSAEFAGRETELLADFLRSIGRDRFQRFWSSSDPVPVAFQQASGMPVGEWMMTWVSDGVPQTPHGPTARAASVVAGMVVAGLCLFLALIGARRREFA
jgi:hypothetical protein